MPGRRGAASPYRSRDPQSTSLYRLVESLYDEVKGCWEECFERLYGHWRGFLDRVVEAYVDCGNFSCGFARVRCPACAAEYLVGFSCQTRSFCPSCAAKRAAIFGAHLAEEVVAEVGHAQWVFTVPKMLRPYFLHHRELLGRLSQAAWQTVFEMIDAAAMSDETVRPGMVAVQHSARSDLAWSPHIHALATRGGWTAGGEWVPVPSVDPDAAEKVFQHKVMRFLMGEGLLTEERAELLLGWRHSGFSVHNTVTVAPDDPDGLERLARYIVRPPVSLGRLELVDGGERATYRVKRSAKPESAGQEVVESFDPRDLLARILMHVVEPRAQVIRYYGEYAVRSRASRRHDGRPLEHGRDLASDSEIASLDGTPDEAPGTDRATRRAQRRAWAQLIRRIYETDPLVCECGATMRIISFITEAGVVDDILRHLDERGRSPGRGPPEDHAPEPF